MGSAITRRHRKLPIDRRIKRIFSRILAKTCRRLWRRLSDTDAPCAAMKKPTPTNPTWCPSTTASMPRPGFAAKLTACAPIAPVDLLVPAGCWTRPKSFGQDKNFLQAGTRRDAGRLGWASNSVNLLARRPGLRSRGGDRHRNGMFGTRLHSCNEGGELQPGRIQAQQGNPSIRAGPRVIVPVLSKALSRADIRKGLQGVSLAEEDT